MLAPRLGVLASTQEIIALLSLLMAGLLPTMLLTATVIRAGTMSATRVSEYGQALRAQMHFWTSVFGACLAGTLAIIAAKMFATEGVQLAIGVKAMSIDQDDLATLAVAVLGFSIGVVVYRLPASYAGILSLLSFNVQMAKEEAAAADRDRAASFVKEIALAASKFTPSPPQEHQDVSAR